MAPRTGPAHSAGRGAAAAWPAAAGWPFCPLKIPPPSLLVTLPVIVLDRTTTVPGTFFGPPF